MKLRYLIALLACSLAPPLQAAPLHVLASFSILADMTAAVAGDDAVITSLVPANADAHAYDLTPKDMQRVLRADLVIANGLGFEPWLARIPEILPRTLIASEGVTPRRLGAGADPHAWQSVPNAMRYVTVIAAGLERADPGHAAAYAARAARYCASLIALDAWVKQQISRVPQAARIAVTTHDAFGYFAETYGIAFLSPLGLSTGGDATAASIAHLVDQLRHQHIRAVFLENMTDARLMRTLAEDGQARIGGTLYTDALSGPNGPAPTYLAMMRYNVKTIVDTLSAP